MACGSYFPKFTPTAGPVLKRKNASYFSLVHRCRFQAGFLYSLQQKRLFTRMPAAGTY
jgi:hypothetical protein